MINRAKFREQYSYFDKEVVVQIIDILEEEYPGRIDQLSESISEKKIPELRKAAHAFKGMIGNFDLDGESYQLIKDIEFKAHQVNDDLDKGRILSENEREALFEEFSTMLGSFKVAMKQLIAELNEIKSEYQE